MKLWEDPRVVKGMTAQLLERRQRLAAGEKPLGWKMGFGAPGAMKLLQTSGPLSGYLLASALLPSGATVDVKGWTQPVAEPEIGVRLGADLASGRRRRGGARRHRIADAGHRNRRSRSRRQPGRRRADPGAQHLSTPRAAVGAKPQWRRHRRPGEPRVPPRQARCRNRRRPKRSPASSPDLLVHFADMLGAFGERLRAGDLVICGSTVPPPLIEADEVEFRHILEPIGEVGVRFTRAETRAAPHAATLSGSRTGTRSRSFGAT